ncbi:MAG: T9SS type A sorting domain-containing protein [Bacteroidales bacterium]|nr:T9SS type A sorting domain-containing protein [Bacteroidales bacterium]MCF8457252.1 T9SS type A sorting domain-containing protein [Bacteroidales bacterium]
MTVLHSIIGENLNGFNEGLSDTKFGYSVAGIGDIDNDGHFDVAVGGTKKDNDSGAVWILFLNSDGSVKSKTRIDKTNSILSSYFNQSLSTTISFGRSLALLTDIDQDGVNEIAVGCSGYETIYGKGSIAVLFLESNGAVQEYKAIHPGIPTFDDTANYFTSFGYSIASIGDINGDQFNDIVVTTPAYNDPQCQQCGAAWIVMLDSLADIVDYQRISDSLGNFAGILGYDDFFGGASTGIGDFNGDLIADVVISAKRDDDGGSNRGAVYILNLNGVPDSTYYMGIKEEHYEMVLYPNPANEQLNIDLGNNPDGYQNWQLYNMQGFLVKESTITPGSKSVQINTSQLPIGIYMVRISGKSKSFTRKVVISR